MQACNDKEKIRRGKYDFINICMSRDVGTGEPAETIGSPKFSLLIFGKLWHLCI
jgi:hypothetical protein